MSNQPKDKNFLAWLQEDFAPMVVAAQESLEPHVFQLQKASLEIGKALTTFIEEHRESIEPWMQFAQIYPQLEPYLDSIMAGLDDPDFEIANDVVEMVHIFESIDIQKAPNAVSLLDVISNEAFQKSLVDFYTNSTLDKDRLPLIKEALHLHNSQFYAGSICLLYGLIEGVITESFEKANYIIINQKRINSIGADGIINQRANLTGLVPKLKHGITHQDQLQNYYSKIKTYQLVAGDPEQTIPKTRNSILHGSSVNFNTEKRSSQLILWLYSAIMHMRVLGI